MAATSSRRRTRTACWKPVLRGLAGFRRSGSTASLTVRVVAEARAGWLMVEGCNADGTPSRFPVKATSLAPLQPGLF